MINRKREGTSPTSFHKDMECASSLFVNITFQLILLQYRSSQGISHNNRIIKLCRSNICYHIMDGFSFHTRFFCNYFDFFFGSHSNFFQRNRKSYFPAKSCTSLNSSFEAPSRTSCTNVPNATQLPCGALCPPSAVRPL